MSLVDQLAGYSPILDGVMLLCKNQIDNLRVVLNPAVVPDFKMAAVTGVCVLTSNRSFPCLGHEVLVSPAQVQSIQWLDIIVTSLPLARNACHNQIHTHLPCFISHLSISSEM